MLQASSGIIDAISGMIQAVSDMANDLSCLWRQKRRSEQLIGSRDSTIMLWLLWLLFFFPIKAWLIQMM